MKPVSGDIICEEHGWQLDDPQLVESVADLLRLTVKEFKELPVEDQHQHQLDFVEQL